MKNIRILISMLLLSAMLTLSLYSCNGNDTPETSDTEAPAADTSDTAESKASETEKEEEEIKLEYCSISFADANEYSNIKLLGRTTQLSTGLAADHTASGISFSGKFKGEICLTLNCTAVRDNELYLTVFIDGERIEDSYTDGKRSEGAFRVGEGEQTVILADFEEEGEHTVTVIKQTESGYALMELLYLDFYGALYERPANKELYIEFIGDSLTCGMGAAGNSTISSAQHENGADWEDGSYSHAYLAAEMMNADYSIIAESGMGVAATWFNYVAKEMFTAASANRKASDEFDFENARKPDLVVINLGTNDYYLGSVGGLKKETTALINLIREKYGEDTKIVWVSGIWANLDGYVSKVDSACEALGGEENGIYRLDLVYSAENGAGAENHPSIKGQQGVAEQLYDFLLSKGLVKE